MSRTLTLYITTAVLSISICLLSAEIILRVQNFIELDGFQEKNPWNSVLHHGDGSFVVEEYGSNCSEGRIKVLLLGDSWMEDPVLGKSIGSEIFLKTGKCVQTINGGNSSYSPTLYLLKARMAFETYRKFDIIIVNIDETDIGDEWLRCRIPLTRNTSGKIIAVPFEKDVQSVYLWNGKLWAENSNFYVVRFIKFAFFYNVLVPSIRNFTVTPDIYSNHMQYVFAPEAATSFGEENEYFQDRLSEMVGELSRGVNGIESVYVSHHPHFRGLVDKVDEGKKYLPVVSDAIEKLGKETGVSILDARKNISNIHGEELLTNTFVDGDPFSHLGSEGASRYGKWIADQVSEKLLWSSTQVNSLSAKRE